MTEQKISYVENDYLVDLAKIFSMTLILFVLWLIFSGIGLLKGSWFTNLVKEVRLTDIIMFSSAVRIVQSGRFITSIAIIIFVIAYQLIMTGGLSFELERLSIFLEVARLIIAFCSGILISLLGKIV